MNTIECVQGSDEWKKIRQAFFTASEAPAMLGLSKYTTRSELLRQKATGTTEDIDPAKQRLFDAGHEAEALARPIAERLIGEDVFPVTGSREVEGLPLLASFDGLTMCEDVDWENKLWNEEFAQQVAEGIVPDTHWPQLEQQLLISGAAKALFTVSDGTEERTVHTWYESQPERRAALIAGWKQFAADLAAYQHVEVIPAAVAAPQEQLPAVMVKVTGSLAVIDNLQAFGDALTAYVGRINKAPQTDQDFADLDATAKNLKQAEEALTAAENNALAQTGDIDIMRRSVANFREVARQARLTVEKIVKAEKENRKNAIILAGKNAMQAHVAELNRLFVGAQLPMIATDFLGAVKGLKSIASVQNAIDTELANAKIAANAIAHTMQINFALLNEHQDHRFLFNDIATLAHKANDDFAAIVTSRISQHVEAKRKEEEATRERIRAEEQAKVQREAAEQQRQKDAAEAKAKADAAIAEEERLLALARQQQTDQATVSQNGASSPPEFPAVLSPAEAVAHEPAPLPPQTATGAASVTLQCEIEDALSKMTFDELQQVAHFIDRLQSLRKAT